MRRELRHFAGRVRGVLAIALVVNGALLWVAILVQAGVRREFSQRRTDALAWHERNATVIGFGALGQLVLAPLAALAGRARWPVIASLVIFLAIGNQITLGYDGDLAVHVPLGVAVFGAQTATALSLVATRSGLARTGRHAPG